MKQSILSVVALLALSTAVSAADDMIGIQFNGDVYTISSSTGIGTLLGPSGTGATNSMAVNPIGEIYTIGAGNLFRIDETTGAATFVGNVGGDVRGMAINSANVMYAIVDGGGGGTLIDDLYKIDLNTLATTLVGSTGLAGIQALAFDSKDNLHGWEVSVTGNGIGLCVIDTSSGVAKDVNPSVDGAVSSGTIQFLTFYKDDTLYAGSSSLYTIDKSTGKSTLVGSGGYSDLRGADFTGPSVPCSATWKNYGTGFPGKLGVPGLSLSANPVLGTKTLLQVGNSAGDSSFALLFFGVNSAAIPGFWGGSLLVLPAATVGLPLPKTGLDLALPIPLDPALCHLSIYFQMVQKDAAALNGASSSRGLRATLGL